MKGIAAAFVIIVSFVFVACGGVVEPLGDPTAEPTERAEEPRKADAPLVVAAPAHEPWCNPADTSVVAWRSGDNSYNARVAFCTYKAGAGAFPLCHVGRCVSELPPKACDDAAFSSCIGALDHPSAVKPAACEPCF